MIAILFPRFDHSAIEERYASWQSQMLLQREEGIEFALYDPQEPASLAAGLIESDHALVITDPLLLPPAHLATRLREVLVHTPEVVAALPVSNEAANVSQRRTPASPYLTLRELQQVTSGMQSESQSSERVTWDRSDPAAYLCRTAFLDGIDDPAYRALEGREVVISLNDYIHRWSSLRGQAREDLLARIGTDAKQILEFGCGEAPLGAALKARQKCRVVGIELDPKAAAIARKRIDDVYCGDARDIVSLMKEKFDWIIGGDIVEHLDEPWSFLAELRHVSAPGGHLLLSIPNVAHASVISDLLQGRFDYVYMGLTCVGHLRFFTRRSIEEMMTIAGWTIIDMVPQQVVATRGRDELIAALSSTRLRISKEDLLPSGYYVVAQNL
ncbi:MAG TPA: class I SAM-dependent methyltransferase [Thermoanaerobaculia bacterium]|nr:class I SAM-dependent methyltransferase [Thermoanaerobaculia bacterium]